MGGAHQRQECQKLDSSKHCCFQEASRRAVSSNQLLVRCVLDRLVIQLSNLTVAGGGDSAETDDPTTAQLSRITANVNLLTVLSQYEGTVGAFINEHKAGSVQFDSRM